MITMPLSDARLNKSAKALLKSNDSLRHRKFHKWILVALLNIFTFGFNKRMIWRLKRQPDNSKTAKRISWNINTLPERAGAQ